MDDTDETVERWQKLVSKAKNLAKEGHVRKAIEITKEALSIHHSEKLEQRLKKMEDYLKAYGDASDSEEENADTMIHMGKGYYLYKDLHDQLYSHQKEGVLWMWSLFQKKKGGILGDDMGLGKTIQVIAFLAGLFDLEKIHCALVVLPTVVLVNWEREFQKWAPGIRLELYHGGSKNERQRTLDKVHRRGGVVLTTYGMVVSSHEQLAKYDGKMVKWDYVILDEGHKIKNPSNKSSKGLHYIQARNRLILSGTPLMNNLKELWALFDWSHHGALLGTKTTFHMQFGDPITKARQKGATPGEQLLGQKMSNSLKEIIAPYFLRRLKAEVEKQEQANKENLVPGKELESKAMPTLTRKNDLVIWVYLSKIQQEIYQGFVSSEEVRGILNSTRSPLTALVQLKKICDHPRLLTVNQCRQLGLRLSEGNLNENQNNESAAASIDYIDDQELIQESGKMVFLVELLNNLRSEGHRTLVFSQSRKILDIIQKVLYNQGHKVARIDGTIKNFYEREEVIKKFTHDKSYNVFLLTTQVGGVGLTITAADRVVIFDPSWNPATDAQAIDRAFRIGQDKNVVVYRLITCGSIEEKIYRRQVFKDSIFRLATGSNDNPYRYFSSLELAELFALDNPRESVTQQQLVKLHSAAQRKTDTTLDAHIAYIHSLAMYGVSDHDLMFSRDSVDDSTDAHEQDFIDQRVNKARTLIQMDNQSNMAISETLGHYPGAGNVEKKSDRPNIPGPIMGWNFPNQDSNSNHYNSHSDDDEDDSYGSGGFKDPDHINVKKVLEASMNLLQLEEDGKNEQQSAFDDEDEDDLKPYDAHAPPELSDNYSRDSFDNPKKGNGHSSKSGYEAAASNFEDEKDRGDYDPSSKYGYEETAPTYADDDDLPDLNAPSKPSGPSKFLQRGLQTAASSMKPPPSKDANQSESSLVIISGDEDDEDDFYDAEDSKSNAKPAQYSPIVSGSAVHQESPLPEPGTVDGSLIFDASDEEDSDDGYSRSPPKMRDLSSLHTSTHKSPAVSSPYKSPAKIGAKAGLDRRRSVAHTPKSPGSHLGREYSPPVVQEEIAFSPQVTQPEIHLDRSTANSAKRNLSVYADDENDDDSPIGTTKKLRPINYIASDDSVDSVEEAVQKSFSNHTEPEKRQLNFDSTVNTSSRDTTANGTTNESNADHTTNDEVNTADVSHFSNENVQVPDNQTSFIAASDNDENNEMETDNDRSNEEIANGENEEEHERMEEEEGQAKEEHEVEREEQGEHEQEEEEHEEEEEEEEEDEEEEEEELTEEEEAEYIRLLTQSKTLYKEGDLINALQYALDALEIYNGDERAQKFTLKLQAKLKMAGTIS